MSHKQKEKKKLNNRVVFLGFLLVSLLFRWHLEDFSLQPKHVQLTIRVISTSNHRYTPAWKPHTHNHSCPCQKLAWKWEPLVRFLPTYGDIHKELPRVIGGGSHYFSEKTNKQKKPKCGSFQKCWCNESAHTIQKNVSLYQVVKNAAILDNATVEVEVVFCTNKVNTQEEIESEYLLNRDSTTGFTASSYVWNHSFVTMVIIACRQILLMAVIC